MGYIQNRAPPSMLHVLSICSISTLDVWPIQLQLSFVSMYLFNNILSLIYVLEGVERDLYLALKSACKPVLGGQSQGSAFRSLETSKRQTWFEYK